ncbi:amidase family protein [Mycobacterium xenopi 3993]|nr:amidase family protein [Mycobacterium xenopi 3993]
MPWHRDAFHMFTVIITDGASYQMLDGNGYGLGVDGLYDPELMAHFATQRLAKADQFSSAVKAVALGGHYGLKSLGGACYAKARNLLPHVRAAYDDALEQYDVLVMPTVPDTADTLPAGGLRMSRCSRTRTARPSTPRRWTSRVTRQSRCRPASSTAAGRNDDRGQAIRRRHRVARRPRLRDAVRRLSRRTGN